MPEACTALITGAARGIGGQVVLTLAERGYRIATNDLEASGTTDEELEAIGVESVSLPGDVSDEGAVGSMVEVVMEGFGRVDMLVNNAGISTIVPAKETALAGWNRTLAVNLTGPFLMCWEFGRAMLERGSGSIVNVSSVAGLLGISDRAAYNASKHGLIGLTRTLAKEWGGRGVHVNAVCHGWVKTEMNGKTREPLRRDRGRGTGHRLSRGPRVERLRQRAHALCGRRLVRGRLMGEPMTSEAGLVAR